MTYEEPVDHLVTFERYAEQIPITAIDTSAAHAVPIWIVGVEWGLYLMKTTIQFALDHGIEPPAPPPIVHAKLVEYDLVPVGRGEQAAAIHLRCQRQWHGQRYARVAAEVYTAALGPEQPYLSVHAVLEADRMATEARITDLIRLQSGPMGAHRRVVGMQVIALGGHRITEEVTAAWERITRAPGNGRR